VTATIDQVLAGVVSTIQGLSLTGVTSANVVSQIVGDDEEGAGPTVAGYPAVICTCNAGETSGEGTNLRDDWVYPVTVVILSAENRSQTTNRARNFQWRQSIKRAFHNKRLSGVSGGDSLPCRVIGGTIADRPRWLQNQQAQSMRIDVTIREVRT